MRENVKIRLRQIRKRAAAGLRFLFNPRLTLCFFVAWMITNGWGYLALMLGILLRARWLQILGGAYLSLLWLPFTPEKMLTAVITIFLLRRLFPRDEKTLGVLLSWYGRVKAAYGRYREKRGGRRKKGG